MDRICTSSDPFFLDPTVLTVDRTFLTPYKYTFRFCNSKLFRENGSMHSNKSERQCITKIAWYESDSKSLQEWHQLWAEIAKRYICIGQLIDQCSIAVYFIWTNCFYLLISDNEERRSFNRPINSSGISWKHLRYHWWHILGIRKADIRTTERHPGLHWKVETILYQHQSGGMTVYQCHFHVVSRLFACW